MAEEAIFTPQIGAYILDSPESYSGWISIEGKTERVMSYEGVLTSPHIAWITNASSQTLDRLSFSKTKRFLPENFFIIHLKDLFETVGVPCVGMSKTERMDRGFDQYFCQPEDPELSAGVLDSLANRIVSLSGVGVVTGHRKYPSCIAATIRGGNRRPSGFAQNRNTALSDISRLEVEHFTKTFSKYVKGALFLHLVPPPDDHCPFSLSDNGR